VFRLVDPYLTSVALPACERRYPREHLVARFRVPAPLARILVEMTRTAAVPPDPPEGRGPLRSVEPVDHDRELTRGGQDNRDGSSLGLELLRELANQEIARAESARARSRQAFAFAATFFAVVQTVSYGSYVTKAATLGHRTGTLINHTAWAALALALCAAGLLIAELPLRSRNLTPKIVLDTIKTATTEDAARDEFTTLYALIVESHRLANKVRFRLVIGTQVLALATIALVLWELLVGLHASL